jgi:hypothetical protein
LPDLEALTAQSVPLEAIEHDFDEVGFAILQDRVAFDDADGFCFERHLKYDETCQTALIAVARDQLSEPIDLVAMLLDRAATWLGRIGCLGLQNIFAPRLLNNVLPIATNALDWLRNERRGILIINPVRARWELANAGPLCAANISHGIALREALALSPEIVVPATAIGLAA